MTKEKEKEHSRQAPPIAPPAKLPIFNSNGNGQKKERIFMAMLLAFVLGEMGACKEINDNMTVADNSQTPERLPGISQPLK